MVHSMPCEPRAMRKPSDPPTALSADGEIQPRYEITTLRDLQRVIDEIDKVG